MELYAAGANQHWQLHFEKQKGEGKCGWNGDDDDIWDFTCVFRHRDIHTVRSFASHTLVYQKRQNKFIKKAGRVPRHHNALRYVDENIYRTFAQANNGRVAVYNAETATINEYATFSDLLLDLGFQYKDKHDVWEDEELEAANEDPSHTHSPKEQFACNSVGYRSPSDMVPRPTEPNKVSYTGFPDIVQLLAHSTGFAALSSTGEVYTWGDERYEGCLGREVTDECPAYYPLPVPLLSNLPTGPIRHLSIGHTSSMLACLTAGNDLYVWGDPRRLPASLQTLFFEHDSCDNNLNDQDGPIPVVITDTKGNEVDGIVDVAVGTNHMIALTDQGEVYVIGENWCGQLGLGEEIECVMKWEKVPLSLDGKVVKSVAAGPWTSFLIVGEDKK